MPVSVRWKTSSVPILRQRYDRQKPEKRHGFHDSFARKKQNLWQMFLKRINANEASESFPEVIKQIENFLRPVVRFLVQGEDNPGHWKAPDTWLKAEDSLSRKH